MKTVTIPVNVLKACILVCSISFDRPFLRNVRVQNGYVCATDGIRAIKVDLGLDKDIAFSIPKKVVKSLKTYRTLALAEANDVIFEIKDVDEIGERKLAITAKQMLMGKALNTCEFEDDLGKYPNIVRNLPNEVEANDKMVWLDWGMVATFQKVAKRLGAIYDSPMLRATGDDKPVIVHILGTKYDVKACIMPLRAKG